ncbi:MAG: GntR family transcriptional regulator [Betaproteobacteria bacterium]|nr:MAG: GntR family transcriptional regulator [Betaproteobacteria bacterium]
MSTGARLFRQTAGPTAASVRELERPSRSELVYQKLRAALESGELRPGQRVMEVEVANWLDVSRTPVREALRRLESEGMLTLEPRMGLVVASISRQAMLELYVMREVLEGTAARLCARHASDPELTELDELVKREARLQGNHKVLARHNRLFHEAIHRGAHNRYLEKSLNAVNDTMHLLGPSQMLIPERAALAQTEHAEIFECIRRHDAEAAEAAARKHVRSAQKQRLKNLFPEA